MQLILSNPAGWWGLLLIPALVLIHSFQVRRKPTWVSTLFLVQQGTQERKGGNTFVFWRHSIAFWLQVLAALLLTALLLQPRWVREESRLQVAFVLDSSLSMDAFLPEVRAAVEEAARELARLSGRTDFFLLETDERAPVLARDPSLDRVLFELENWVPSLGNHSISTALRRASALVGAEGAVILVTDRIPNHLPAGVRFLAVGAPVENVGFTGASVRREAGSVVWRTMIRNYSARPVTRSWWIQAGNQQSEPRPVSLEPGGSLVLSGTFPPDVFEMELQLEDDEWGVDNRVPLVVAHPKQLRVASGLPGSGSSGFYPRLLAGTNHLVPAGSLQPDLLFGVSGGLERTVPDVPFQVLFYEEPADRGDGNAYGVEIVREDHPLVRGLDWNGLLLDAVGPVEALSAGEEPLLWAGNKPLVWVRNQPRGMDLVFNFGVESANLSRLPAFVILLHRFVERARQETPAFERRNLETGEEIVVASRPATASYQLNGQPVDGTSLNRLRAPARPGFLHVTADETPWFVGAVSFSDVREADFSEASAGSNLPDLVQGVARSRSDGELLLVLGMLILTGVLFFSWNYAERAR